LQPGAAPLQEEYQQAVAIGGDTADLLAAIEHRPLDAVHRPAQRLVFQQVDGRHAA
jgi:hypothetical protein